MLVANTRLITRDHAPREKSTITRTLDEIVRIVQEGTFPVEVLAVDAPSQRPAWVQVTEATQTTWTPTMSIKTRGGVIHDVPHNTPLPCRNSSDSPVKLRQASSLTQKLIPVVHHVPLPGAHHPLKYAWLLGTIAALAGKRRPQFAQRMPKSLQERIKMVASGMRHRLFADHETLSQSLRNVSLDCFDADFFPKPAPTSNLLPTLDLVEANCGTLPSAWLLDGSEEVLRQAFLGLLEASGGVRRKLKFNGSTELLAQLRITNPLYVDNFFWLAMRLGLRMRHNNRLLNSTRHCGPESQVLLRVSTPELFSMLHHTSLNYVSKEFRSQIQDAANEFAAGCRQRRRLLERLTDFFGHHKPSILTDVLAGALGEKRSGEWMKQYADSADVQSLDLRSAKATQQIVVNWDLVTEVIPGPPQRVFHLSPTGTQWIDIQGFLRKV